MNVIISVYLFKLPPPSMFGCLWEHAYFMFGFCLVDMFFVVFNVVGRVFVCLELRRLKNTTHIHTRTHGRARAHTQTNMHTLRTHTRARAHAHEHTEKQNQQKKHYVRYPGYLSTMEWVICFCLWFWTHVPSWKKINFPHFLLFLIIYSL